MVQSTAVVRKGNTILETAVQVIKIVGNKPMAPKDVAEIGLDLGLFRVPRGRTRSYLTQLVQSELFNNLSRAERPLVQRPRLGYYKLRNRAL
jgi:hypothetical protein